MHQGDNPTYEVEVGQKQGGYLYCETFILSFIYVKKSNIPTSPFCEHQALASLRAAFAQVDCHSVAYLYCILL